MRLSSFASVRKAFRRSRLRAHGLLVLVEFGEASILDVAIALGADPANVRGAFEGDGERFRFEHSLMRLGLVTRRVREGMVLYRATLAGLRVARILRQERRREARARRVSALRDHST